MYQDHKVDWTKWRTEIKKEFGITTLTTLQELKTEMKKGALLCSRCSAVKNDTLDIGTPSQIYTGKANKKFYNYCEFLNFRYAILSDLYGLVFDDTEIKTYDKHPSKVTEEGFIQLGGIIREKLKERKYTSIIFFNSSPVMSKPYFYMMYLTGLPIYYISKLPIQENFLGGLN